MSLHDRIMNIPEENDDGLLIGEDKYWIGFVNGKHQAAQIAKEADEFMAEMAKALRVAAMSKDPEIGPDAYNVIMKYNAWKEATK